MLTFRHKTRTLFRGWVPLAAAEVALIFIGITLAIAFDNWNTERADRSDERAILRELRSNLLNNISELESDLEFDLGTVIGIESILAHLDARLAYSEDLSSSFARLDNWDSPYLTSATYETLKSRGLDIVMDPTLAASIARLFEKVYVSLVSDHDRAEWINYEISMVPLMLAHVEERPGDVAEPTNYDALLDDRSFRVALLRTLALRIKGTKLKREAIQSTREVIQMIDTALES